MLVPNASLATEIIKFSINSTDFEETNLLKVKFASIWKQRKPFFLLARELDEIIKWKLDTQYHRSKEQRNVNTDSVVIPITQSCFAITSSNRNYEIELKLKSLTNLRGVAIPLASAVLSICLPEKFVVIDSVLWEEIYGVEKSAFSVNDYMKFLQFFEDLSVFTKKDLQTTEHMLWLYLQKFSTV